MTGLLIDVKKDCVKLIEVTNRYSCSVWIGCKEEYIEIISRKIEGKKYKVVCDNKALLRDNPIISALNENLHTMLMGNLIILADEDGGDASLKVDDLLDLKDCIGQMFSDRKPDGYPVVCWMER